jgi:hypothetical protein
VRLAGVVDSARGLAPLSHLGWGYTDRAEFRTSAREYLADGIAAGHRLEYVGNGGVDRLRAELAGFADVDELLGRGDLRVAPVEEVYELAGATGVVDPVGSVAARVAATEAALAAGYAGLRAAVDATALARTDAQRAAYAHYEYLLDQRSRTLPLATICAFDRTQLGHAAVAELVGLHPCIRRGCTAFRLYVEDGVDLALAGEIDIYGIAQLEAMLGQILPLMSGTELVVGGRGLEFIDHRGLLVLDRCAAKRGIRLVLQSEGRGVARVAELIGLEHVRVEGSGERRRTAR